MISFFSDMQLHDDDDVHADAQAGDEIQAEKRRLPEAFEGEIVKEKPVEIMQGAITDFDLLYWYFITKKNTEPVKIYGVTVTPSMFDDFVMNKNVNVLLDALGKIETQRQKKIAKPLELRIQGQVDLDEMSPEDELKESPLRDIVRKKLLNLYKKEHKKKKAKYGERDYPPNMQESISFLFQKAPEVESVIVYTVKFTRALFEKENSEDDDVYIEFRTIMSELMKRVNAVINSTQSLLQITEDGQYYYEEYDNEVLDSVLEAIRFFYLTNYVKPERKKRPAKVEKSVRYNTNKLAVEDPDDDQATVLGDEDKDLDDEATVKGDEDLTDDEGDATTRDKFFARN